MKMGEDRLMLARALREEWHPESGMRLRDIRSAAGMSQKQVADACGVTPAFISRIEAGDRRPSYEVFTAIGAALDCELGLLLKPVDPVVPLWRDAVARLVADSALVWMSAPTDASAYGRLVAAVDQWRLADFGTPSGDNRSDAR